MRRRVTASLLGVMTSLACAGNSNRETLAELRDRAPDLSEAPIDSGIDQAMAGYRKFLAEAPKSALTPEAMRRLADLKLEKEYGLLGAPDSLPAPASELPAPTVESTTRGSASALNPPAALAQSDGPSESQSAFEARAARKLGDATASDDARAALSLPGGEAATAKGPLEAIALYDQILATYPNYAQTDQVLYQKARAFDELGRVDEAVAVAKTLVERFPKSRHIDEIQFRRAEYFFTRKKYMAAEESYASIIEHGPGTGYYELALYKLGWSYYKQMMLEEALDSYVRLLDHKVASDYDFEQAEDETEEQRIADTYRVMSLCFSDLGGAEAVSAFFAAKGERSYEHRVYRHLGEFYLEKRRYNDAASAYEAFVALNPNHKISPHFSMRVVEIYDAGQFPKLVLAAKKKFAASYGLDSDYWAHFEKAEAPEVIAYLKGNLEDLANHYHALYQNTERLEEKPGHFAESALWYRAYLGSFPAESETPGIHYQLADLLLQNEDFVDAAGEYEHIAYEYPPHDRAAAAGYAAIFARRQFEKQVDAERREAARRASVASTLRFVDRYPEHEHAAAVLGAAVDDLYALEDHAQALANGHRLLAEYPQSEESIRRGAWTVIGHASFDTESFESSEEAYTRVLELTPAEDESGVAIMNNLAAAIYKQGELANAAGEYRAAADHFLRIADAAPASEIRPIAEYDASAALIQLADWAGAGAVLEAFRERYPDHELSREATRQIAFVYREDGNLARAAEEYERVAGEATEPELRREALLVAAGLYEEAELITEALSTYRDYVTQFTQPIEPAVVARFKMAGLYHKMEDEVSRRAELERIVTIDRNAGDARTDGVRLVAGRSALILSEDHFERFADVELVLPFEKSLELKKRRMDEALETFGDLLDYEVGEVTAAATFYMAETYAEFSRALLDSERPKDLGPKDRDDYEMVLEEEAYPFEEKSIDVHEKNLELMRAGVYNAWIEKSLAELAVVMPGRYAKFEASTGPLESITTYAYQSPRAQIVAALETTRDPAADLAEESGAEDVADAELIAAEPSPSTEEPDPASKESLSSSQESLSSSKESLSSSQESLPASPDPTVVGETAAPAPLEMAPAAESDDSAAASEVSEGSL